MKFLAGIGSVEDIPAKAAVLFGLMTNATASGSEQQELGRLLLTKVARIETPPSKTSKRRSRTSARASSTHSSRR